MKRFTVIEIERFILANYERAQTWETKSLRNWINWLIEQGFCLLTGEDKQIKGVLFARPVMNAEQATKDGLYYDMEGTCYFIDLAIVTAPKREGVQALAFALLKRFGQRDMLAFHRHGHGPLIVIDAHKHRQKLLRPIKV